MWSCCRFSSMMPLLGLWAEEEQEEEEEGGDSRRLSWKSCVGEEGRCGMTVTFTLPLLDVLAAAVLTTLSCQLPSIVFLCGGWGGIRGDETKDVEEADIREGSSSFSTTSVVVPNGLRFADDAITTSFSSSSFRDLEVDFSVSFRLLIWYRGLEVVEGEENIRFPLRARALPTREECCIRNDLASWSGTTTTITII